MKKHASTWVWDVVWKLEKSWLHMKFFSVETLNITSHYYVSISDKIQQVVILMVGDVFIFYHVVFIDMLDFKNSIWQLICTKISYSLVTPCQLWIWLQKSANEKTCYINDCIRINILWKTILKNLHNFCYTIKQVIWWK